MKNSLKKLFIFAAALLTFFTQWNWPAAKREVSGIPRAHRRLDTKKVEVLHKSLEKLQRQILRSVAKFPITATKAYATIGQNSDYFLAAMQNLGASIAPLSTSTDCEGGGGLLNGALCALGDALDLNGYGTYTGSYSSTDYTLRVSAPGGDYRYLVEIWKDISSTKRRVLTLYRNEAGTKYIVYFSVALLTNEPSIAIKITVDTSTATAQTLSSIERLYWEHLGAKRWLEGLV